MSLRHLLHRLLPTLGLLLCVLVLLDACTTRRSSNNDDDDAADDDDSAGDDDDASGDDDDASGDDDDASGDDDDASGDDDDASGDDDDSTQGDDDDSTTANPGILQVSADATVLGPTAIGSQDSTTLYFENLGGTTLTVQLTLSDLSGTWILQGGTTVLIPPSATESRTLLFQPSAATAYSLTVDAAHDGANASPQQLIFVGSGSGGGPNTETSCTNGVDDDNDTLVDCADPDCANDPACTSAADPCCAPNSQFANGPCQNTSVESCVCGADSFCCTDWDQACVEQYDGSTGHCGPSGTCGP